jgi:hypothetical protein
MSQKKPALKGKAPVLSLKEAKKPRFEVPALPTGRKRRLP